MLGGKYVSIDSIIERVQRDFGFTWEIRKADCIEWLFDLIDLVGAPTAFVERTTDGNLDIGNPSPIIIDDYRGELPCDFHSCISCRSLPEKIMMHASTNLFHISTYNLSDYSYTVTTDYDLPSIVDTGTTHNIYSYKLNNNYIFTDFQTGLVEMFYLAFPSDKDGYPMIPDDTRYIKAAVFYLAKMIGTKMWFQNKLSKEKFDWIEQQECWYIGSAGNSARTMNADEREAFRNQVLRMIPATDAHRYGNKYLSETQWLRNHRTR